MSTSSANDGISLLDLPQNVRHRIYYFIGLHRRCPIILAGRTTSRKLYRIPPRVRRCTYPPVSLCSEWECFCPPIPTSIFTVCQSLYVESLIYFYGSNNFQLLGRHPLDLDVFYTLSPLALFSMKSLLIQLDHWRYRRIHNQSFRVRDLCETFALSSALDENPSMMEAWERLCEYLSKRIRPDQLQLTFVCDAVQLSYAKQICQSIAHLPCLQICNIRLGLSPNHNLSSLAREAAQKQMPIYPIRPFQFFRLPAEVRFQILQYTHLNPMADSFAPHFRYLTIVNGQSWLYGSRYLASSKCCRVCTGTKDCCCCPWSRAAFSTTCSCRLIPFDLFLVSKQMKQEAQYILFRLNRLDFCGDVLQAVAYLDRLGKQNLWPICHIRFIFSYRELSSWGEETLSNWRFVVNYIKDNLNIKNLCLVVDIQRNFAYPSMDPNGVGYGVERDSLIYRMLCEIALALTVLSGLQDLHLKFPWFTSLEKLLEQEVIGSGYDSYHGVRRSKEPRQDTDWVSSRLPSWHPTVWTALTSTIAKDKRVNTNANFQ